MQEIGLNKPCLFIRLCKDIFTKFGVVRVEILYLFNYFGIMLILFKIIMSVNNAVPSEKILSHRELFQVRFAMKNNIYQVSSDNVLAFNTNG